MMSMVFRLCKQRLGSSQRTWKSSFWRRLFRLWIFKLRKRSPSFSAGGSSSGASSNMLGDFFLGLPKALPNPSSSSISANIPPPLVIPNIPTCGFFAAAPAAFAAGFALKAPTVNRSSSSREPAPNISPAGSSAGGIGAGGLLTGGAGTFL